MSEILHAIVGATFQEPLTILDRDGTPADLTGAALTWMAKARIDDADVDAILTATTAAGTIDIDADPTTGKITFDIPAATMAAVPPRSGRSWYAWSLQVFSGGKTTRYPDDREGGPGKLIVSPSVIVTVPT